MKVLYRIRKNEEFQSIINSNKFIKHGGYVIYYSKNNLDHIRVGITTSKKLGIAVTRNKIRRQIRAMIDEVFDFTTPIDLIIIVRRSYLDSDYQKNKEILSLSYKKIMEAISE